MQYCWPSMSCCHDWSVMNGVWMNSFRLSFLSSTLTLCHLSLFKVQDLILHNKACPELEQLSLSPYRRVIHKYSFLRLRDCWDVMNYVSFKTWLLYNVSSRHIITPQHPPPLPFELILWNKTCDVTHKSRCHKHGNPVSMHVELATSLITHTSLCRNIGNLGTMEKEVWPIHSQIHKCITCRETSYVVNIVRILIRFNLLECFHTEDYSLRHTAFLGAVAQLRKATTSFVISVCLSVCLSSLNNSALVDGFWWNIKF